MFRKISEKLEGMCVVPILFFALSVLIFYLINDSFREKNRGNIKAAFLEGLVDEKLSVLPIQSRGMSFA
jgi:hypothetical protein